MSLDCHCTPQLPDLGWAMAGACSILLEEEENQTGIFIPATALEPLYVGPTPARDGILGTISNGWQRWSLTLARVNMEKAIYPGTATQRRGLVLVELCLGNGHC